MITPIDYIRSTVWLMRSTAALLLFAFNFVFFFSPTALAIEESSTEKDRYQAKLDAILEATPAQKLAHRLQKLKESVTQDLSEKVTERALKSDSEGLLDQVASFFTSNAVINQNELEQLTDLKLSIDSAYLEAMQGFEQDTELLDREGMPDVVRERYQAAKVKIKDKFDKLNEKLNVLLSQDDGDDQQQALDEVIELLNESQFKRTHTAEDPYKLPWRTPENKVRKPALSRAQLSKNLGIDPYPSPLQLASSDGSLDTALATLEEFEKPGAAELTATIDAPVTTEIQALADQLNNNVVEIYTWVHNNIRFIPSYGSIQGAQMTLETKRGNAIDTASLTIALLRASNIPARYVYGTVEIPAEKVMNWVGGVNNASAAGNLLGQGGIPSTGIIMGGQVKYFQLEHVWTEAYVDFEPSRGLKNGPRDNWIPLDGSFKQYEFSQGMELEQEVPFDAQALVDDIQSSATINEDEGWVQNVPSQAIEQKLEEYQQALTDYIENQNPDATVGEVLGLQAVKVVEARPLAAGLPYNHIVTSNTFSEVPDNLRHRFKYELSTEANEYLASPFISINEPTVKLAGKKLSLSFAPATQDDADIIESYLPEPDPQTGEIDPAQIPDTLPGYLINLKAEFAIGNEVVASEMAGSMGTELHETLGYWDPNLGWDLSRNKPTAGEYQAIGLDLQGSSPEYAARLQADMEATKAKLESGDETQLADLSKQNLVGDMLEATIFSYFAMNNLQDDIAAQQANIVNYRLPSYGKFSTSLATSYWFGTPRNVSASGLAMDVDRVFSSVVDKNNDTKAWVNYNQMVGNRYSAMEHLIPEQMFSTPEAPAQGISAVKAIALASAQGQKIWTITQDNLDVALAAINLDADSETEIRNGVNAGNVVTAHEQSISFNGWVGEGYIIINPATGAGAYKIAGGGNGSQTDQDGPGLDWLGMIKAVFEDTLNRLKDTALGGYFKKMYDNITRVFNYAKTAGECGVSFLIFQQLGLLAFSFGVAQLFLPYLALLSAFIILRAILQVVIIDLLIVGMYGDRFNCKK